MKKLLLIISILALFNVSFAQQWKSKLPKNKTEYTFYDYQKAFNDFWKPYNVVGGYYTDTNGNKRKASGWKQFKRWEWFWKYRVDAKTGEFPKTTAVQEFEKWQKKYPQSKNTTQGNWTSIGPANVNSAQVGTGRVNCITFDPSDDNHYWIGAPAGGVWETTDNGSTWSVLTDNNDVLGVSTILLPSDYNSTSNKTIYIGTGDRDGGSLWGLNGGQSHDNESVGVLKTTDGGATWSATGLTFDITAHATVGKLVGHPSDPNTIWAATNYGIYKTTDGGATWSLKQADAFIDLEMKPGDPNTLYASTSVFGTPYPRIYRSTDGGNTWAIVQQFTIDQYRVDLTVSANSPTTVYAVVSMTDYNGGYAEYGSLYGIYKSTNSGASFSQIWDGTANRKNLCGWETDGSDAGGQGDYDLAFVANPSDVNELYFGGVNGFKSTAGGTSWDAVSCWTTSIFYNHNSSPVVHADHHMMQYRADGALFDCNDGGVYYTTNGGNSWNNVTPGLVNGQLYGIGVAQDVADEIVGGFQDNGTKRTQNANTWDDVKGGDGMHCAIDINSKDNQYGTYAQGQIDHTTNDWGSASSIRSSGSADWAAPLEIDPAGGDVLFYGDEYVKRYNGGTSTLSQALTNAATSNNYLTALAVYHNGATLYVYAAGDDGTSWKIWKSPAGGGSGSGYTDISGNLPGNAITDIEVDYNDPNHIWVTLGGYDENRIYETTNGGTTWTNISDGLPHIPAMTVVQYDGNTTEDELYIGMDIGVYVKQGTSPWVLFSNGIPNVVMSDLEFYYGSAGTSDDKLYGATFGRGVWKTDPYLTPTLDAAISSIVAPADEYCDLSASPISPQVVLANIGNTTLTSCDISYTYDAGAPVNYHWTGSLTKGASTTVTLPNLTLTYGSHTFEATVSNPNGGVDQNSVNDTQLKTFDIWNNTLNYTQNFDNFNTGITYVGDPVLDLSECWSNDATQNLGWSVATGGTASGNTGPQNGDHTSGSGNFLYTESSGTASSGAGTARLLSPTFDLTNYTSSHISFWYYMYGANIGSIQVDLFYGGGWHDGISVSWNGTSATSLSGDQGQNWLQATADISAADGDANVQIRIASTTGTDFAGDLSIDDFNIDGTSTSSCTYPTTQASSFAATPHETTEDISWTNGNGNRVIILAHEAAAVNADPVDNTTYTSNAAFGSGTQIGTGNYVVYDGTGTNVTVTGLTANTTYYYAIYSYNSTGPCYLTPALTGNKLTLPAQPSVITGSTTPCEGSSETYSVTSVLGVTYTWAFPADWSITAGQGTNSVTVTVGATDGNATVTPSNASGNGTTRTLAITVSPLPTAPSSVSATPSSITAGNSTTLSYTGGSGTTFEWYSGSCGGTSVGSGNNVSVSPTSTTTYYGRWENGCGVSACQSVTVTVTTNPPTITNVSPNNFFADKGSTLNITGTYLSGASVDIAGVSGTVTSNDGSTIIVDFNPGLYTNNTLTVATGTAPDATSTVTVNTRNVIPVGGGTDPHTTIQSALDGLFAWFGTSAFSTSTAGYLAGTKTIEVYNGTYTEKITPNVNLGTTASEGLIIHNAAGQQPVVDASGLTNAFYIGALDYVTISGFTAHSSTDAVIYTEGDNNVIEYNKCYGSTTGAGIILNNAITTKVQNNPVYNNNTFGIRLIASNNAVVKNNTIANNGNEAKAPPLPGVYTPAQLYVESGTGVSVSNNIIFAKSGTNVFTLLTESGITVSSDYNTYFKNGNTSLVYYNGTVYADIAAWTGNGAGANDLETNPDFVNAGTDFHIKSTNGSYPYPSEWPPEAAASTWNNDASTSPALDAGNPGDAYANEPVSGGRINQGAYGNTAQASKSAGLIWDGSTSIDWQTTTNWTPEQIPTSTSDIIIPDGMPNYPVIDDGTTTAVCNNMTINANASVTIATNGQMTVSGSITNNAGAAGLIVKSDATGDGSLIVNNTPAATVERFVTGNQWHMMFPTLDAVPTTTYTTEGSDVNNNFYSYNEPNEDYWTSTTVYGTTGWISEVGATNIRTDKGYLFNRYNMGDKTFVQTGGNLYGSDKTFNVSYNVSSIAIGNGANSDRTNYDGWNLAGNPYTSAVNWNSVTLNGIESGIYYFDGSNYKYFMQGGDGSQNPPYDIGISVNGGSQFIPSGQGFMVKVINTGSTHSTTFTIPNTARAHNNQQYWKGSSDLIPNLIKLNIEKDGYTDETVVRTLPTDVTENHDSKYDAYKMFAWDNSKPQIYSFNTNQSTIYAINSLPEMTENKTIPLGVYIGTAGQYVINNLENNFIGFDVFLHDISYDAYTKMIDNTSYIFESQDGTINDRFELVFKKSTSNTNDLSKISVSLYPNPNTGSFYLTVSNAPDNYRVEITNVTGQVIFQNKYTNFGTKEIKLDPVSKGIYFVKVIFDNNNLITKKIVIE